MMLWCGVECAGVAVVGCCAVSCVVLFPSSPWHTTNNPAPIIHNPAPIKCFLLYRVWKNTRDNIITIGIVKQSNSWIDVIVVNYAHHVYQHINICEHEKWTWTSHTTNIWHTISSSLFLFVLRHLSFPHAVHVLFVFLVGGVFDCSPWSSFSGPLFWFGTLNFLSAFPPTMTWHRFNNNISKWAKTNVAK